MNRNQGFIDSTLLNQAFDNDLPPSPTRTFAPPPIVRTEADNTFRARAWIVIWILTAAIWSAIYLAFRGLS